MASGQKATSNGRGLLLIAAFKFLKGIGLFLVGLGALHYLHRDLASSVEYWLDFLRVDPHNHHVTHLLAKIIDIDPKRLRELSIITFCYSALFLTEGTGLVLRKRWAEYLTSISTASLIPFEVYEIFHEPSLAKVLLLLFNIGIVVYLVRELRRNSPR